MRFNACDSEVIVCADGTIRCERDGFVVEEISAFAPAVIFLGNEKPQRNLGRFFLNAALALAVASVIAVLSVGVVGLIDLLERL